MAKELATVTAAGYKVVLSACWYLSRISFGDDWVKVSSFALNRCNYVASQYYECDPQDFNGTVAQKELVMGGGVAMWSEYVDSTNLLSRMWWV